MLFSHYSLPMTVERAFLRSRAVDAFLVPVSTGTVTITFTTVINNAKISTFKIQ